MNIKICPPASKKSSSNYGMEVSTSKSKGMANSRDQEVRTAVCMCGEVLEDVDHFKYLGSILNRDGTSTKRYEQELPKQLDHYGHHTNHCGELSCCPYDLGSRDRLIGNEKL